MDQEYINTIIKEIDKLLEIVPPDNIRCDMNQYVNDYIYKSGLLKKKIECRICENCRENNISNCENCELCLKKKELYNSIKLSNKLSKRNKRKNSLKKFSILCGKTFVKIAIILVALFGITFDSTVKKMFYDYIPITSIPLREQELKCLRTNFFREYIETQLGRPKSVYEISLFKKSYFRTAYVDKYYTLLCYYNDIGSLLGYMIISNRNDFRYQCYRSDIKLLENSVSEARNILEEEGIVGEYIKHEKFAGFRLDNNLYYYECKMQHGLGGLEYFYVGFGYTDIGYFTDKIEPNMNPNNVKINFITVFAEYNFNERGKGDIYFTTDFINDYVINDAFAGLSKGDLTNLSEDIDFNNKINEYLDEYKQ